MKFTEAFELVAQGVRVTRRGWSKTYNYIEVACDVRYSTIDFVEIDTSNGNKKSLALSTKYGTYVGWLPSNVDLFAKDWMIYEDKKQREVECV